MFKFVLMSAERSDRSTLANEIATETLEAWLTEQNYAFKSVVGCYQGTKELSFVVLAPTKAKVSNLVAQSRLYDQECILAVNSQSKAFLVDGDTYTPIGQFKAIAGKPASDNWTFDPYTGEYYEVS